MEYTKYANEVLRSAKNIAKKANALYIGTEHVLLALLKVKKSVASQVLEKNDVRYEDVNKIILELMGVSDYKKSKINHSIRLNLLLKQSAIEAAAQRSKRIGSEHLLIAIARDDETTANRILHSLNISNTDLLDDLMIGEDREEGEISEQEKSSSNNFLKDLTELAESNKLDPVLGRDEELRRVIEIISRRTKNNPCLIGEPGIGKTAIVEGLALQIVSGAVPENLKNKRILSMDLAGMLAGTKYRGEFEERIKNLIKQVERDDNIILFMDEVHTIIGAGGSEGSVDAANILKPALSRGQLQLIGATTTAEYRKYIEKDLALERRFQPIAVSEPNTDQCIEILSGIKHKYESHHQVVIKQDILRDIVELSKRYITDRYLPDKAIDILDESCAKVNLQTKGNLIELEKYNLELKNMENQFLKLIQANELDLAKMKKCEILELNKTIMKHKKSKKRHENKEVTIEDVRYVVSRWSKVPITKLKEDDLARLINLETELKKRITGQEEAIITVAKAIKRGRVGLKSPKRPIGSFLFLGPTGVGKTELTKALTEILFDTEDSLIRLDMSEYMEKQSVSKLIGSPPGYVGYGEGGQLTDRVRTNPYSVILFDEVEKAHPDVFNVLLQVLDEGHVTDSKGRKIDFKNTIIIMTSNSGANTIVEPKELGFAINRTVEDKHKKMKTKVMDELKLFFRPEFINRIDDIIVFHMLENEHMVQIVEHLSKRFIEEVKTNINIDLDISQEVKGLVLEKGTDKKYGARPLRRALQQEVEDELTNTLLEGGVKSGDKVLAYIVEGRVKFQKK